MARAPENTAAAFATALEADVDGIETDVRLSADGVPFLLHDETLGRTTDAVARGFDAGTRAETVGWDNLTELDAGSWFDARFTSQRLVALSDFPELAHRGVIDLELKLPTDHSPEAVVEAVARTLALPSWQGAVDSGRVVVTSFDPTIVGLALETLSLPVGLLTEVAPSPAEIEELAALGVHLIAPAAPGLGPETARACRGAGIGLWTWTVNDRAEFARLAALGVDAICTDDPLRMRG